MWTRRDILRMTPAAALLAVARAAEGPDFQRVDTHVHIHRDAPALLSALKGSGWRGLDIVVCPAVGDEPFDLEQKLRATLKVARDSGGTLAWASTFDARGFERPDFADRSIERLRRSFDDGAVAVKIWKTIGMAIKSKSGDYLLPDDPALLPIYEAIQRADRTLVAHLAEPDGAWLPLDDKNPELDYYSKNPQWHMFGKPGAPVKGAILAARDKVLARYPKLRVVGCHLGSDEDDLGRSARCRRIRRRRSTCSTRSTTPPTPAWSRPSPAWGRKTSSSGRTRSWAGRWRRRVSRWSTSSRPARATSSTRLRTGSRCDASVISRRRGGSIPRGTSVS